MRNLSFPKIVLGFAALCLLVVLLHLVTGRISQAGPFFIAFFVLLAIGFRGYPSLKGFAYTVTIFAAVTTAMYYPQYFRTWNGFVLSTLITPLLQIIMFGMGTSMGIKDFAGVIKTPKGVFIGVVSHFIIMPLIGYTLASISGLPPEIAAGIILIGCSPNGMASNVISYLAKANLALSITITAVSTMLSPFVTPFLMKWLAGAFVNINAVNMMWDIIKMVILPIGAGILFNRLFSGKAKWLDTAMPIVSMTGIAFIIVIITAAGRDNLLQIGLLLIVFVLIHNLAGYTLGYWTGRLFKMNERDCRTMAIEVGMQNGGLASGLAKAMGKMATVGLAPAIFGPLMNITGSILASWWHRRPPKEKPAAKAVTSVLVFLLIGCATGISSCGHQDSVTLETGNDYPVYGGNKAGNRYSPLQQINAGNVKTLKLAWTYDVREKVDTTRPGYRWGHEIQCQPVVVNGILYGTTPALAAFAIDAATGKQKWTFEPPSQKQRFNTNRGMIYWAQGDDHRIIYSAGSNLYALDASTGKLVETFGDHGRVDLHEGLDANLGHSVQHLSVTATTPGVIYHNTLVIGSSVSEGGDAAPGHVRGFDVITGKLKWTFHTIPQPGEPGYETWPKDAYKHIGAANNWSGLVVDEKRGWVFFGTGSPSSDFYGGEREGMNLYANCILALDAETGKMRWYFQTIHHDLWDRDIPCQPNLATLKFNGRMVDVVAQATKDGLVYVLNRDSGYSMFPMEEVPVPTAGLPGEHPWPAQRRPVKPKPFSHQLLTEAELTDISPAAHDYAKAYFEKFHHSPDKFTPPDTAGTLAFGYSGGAEWGGNAIDPSGIMYVNANEDAWELQLVDETARERQLASLSQGNRIYVKNCAACHGMDRKGSGHEFPNLLDIGKRRAESDIAKTIAGGSGRMPGFGWLPEKDRKALVAFLAGKEEKLTGEHADASAKPGEATNGFPYQPRYISRVWHKFVDSEGYNAVKPPWGTLNAIDLATGEYKWRVPLGEFPELTKRGVPITGTENYGGPLVTAGGMVFIAATRDERIRAFDKQTGNVVWEYQLPAGGFASPITYAVNGKQYIALAVGGCRGAKPGGYYMAFSLP